MLRFAEVVTYAVSQITSFETGGETSREVAKRPGKVAKRPATMPSCGVCPSVCNVRVFCRNE